jgi:CheY-like chemotaxis protein
MLILKSIEDDKIMDRCKQILIADDNRLNRIFLSNFFERMNYTVETIENGKDAVEKSLNSNYDIIFMDTYMPVMDGYEATKNIRENHKNVNCETIIIAITAFKTNEEKDKCLKSGMNECLIKPFVPEYLLELILKYSKKGPVKLACESDVKLDFVTNVLSKELMSDFFQLFLGGYQEFLDKIQKAFIEEDRKSLVYCFHKLKGSLSNFVGEKSGIGNNSFDIVNDLEIMTPHCNLSDLSILIDNLKLEIEKMEEFYNQVKN